MPLTMKDLAAFAAAERQIQALPTAEGHDAVEGPSPLPTDLSWVKEEKESKPHLGHEGHDHEDIGPCDEPWVCIQHKCDPDDDAILCKNHGMRLLMLMLGEGLKRGKGVPDDEMATCGNCGKPALDCWTPRHLTDEEKADLS